MDFLPVKLGRILLFTAFSISLFSLFLVFFEREGWFSKWKKTLQALFFVVLLANLTLVASLVSGRYDVLYVAEHSNSAMPLFYKISALWGGQEGSLLFWTLLLLGWGIFLKSEISRFAGFFISVTILFFLVLVNWIKSPFLPAVPPPQDGRDLNPLLQHPGMVAHPVFLYLGFTGSVYQFALFLSRLEGFDVNFRKWALIDWGFLTLGIVLGGWWAYSELGWGGYWAWDPVENVSFLPWLTLTAFIHTKMVTRNLGGLKFTSLLLSFITFFLAISGTFLVRTGLFISVHSFVQDPELGVAFLVFLFLLLVSFSVFTYLRWDKVLGKPFLKSFVSREFFIVLGSLVLFSMWIAVFFGTISPVFWEFLTGQKISFGKPFFDKIFAPLSVILIITLALGQSLSWREDNLRKFLLPFLLSLPSFLLYHYLGLGVLGLWAITFGVLVVLKEWFERIVLRNTKYFSTKRFFALLSHIGFLVVCIGILFSELKSKEAEFEMKLGDKIQFGGFEFELSDVKQVQGPNWIALQVDFSVLRDGEKFTVSTQKRFYRTWEEPTTEAGIRWGLFEDVYVVVSKVEENRFLVKIFLNKGVSLIWIGTVISVLGGVVAGLKKVG